MIKDMIPFQPPSPPPSPPSFIHKALDIRDTFHQVMTVPNEQDNGSSELILEDNSAALIITHNIHDVDIALSRFITSMYDTFFKPMFDVIATLDTPIELHLDDTSQMIRVRGGAFIDDQHEAYVFFSPRERNSLIALATHMESASGKLTRSLKKALIPFIRFGTRVQP